MGNKLEGIEQPSFITDMIDGIRLCSIQNFTQPTLTLIYTLIDILAWLDLEPSNRNNMAGGHEFQRWIKVYMLRSETRLKCMPLDLWGARCAFLHTGTTKSDSLKKGARRILYATGDYEKFPLQTLVDQGRFPGYESAIVVHLEKELIFELIKGIYTFFASQFHGTKAAGIRYKIKMQVNRSKITPQNLAAII